MNIINDNNNSLDIVDSKYIIQSKEYYGDYYNGYTMKNVAMYDIAGNKLYDFEEKNAEIEWEMNGYDAFITKYYDKGIETYDVVFKGEVVDTFAVKGNEYISHGYYSVYLRYVETGVDTFEYRLYNAKGEQLLKNDSYIQVIADGEDKVVVGVEVFNETTSKYEINVYTFNFVDA